MCRSIRQSLTCGTLLSVDSGRRTLSIPSVRGIFESPFILDVVIVYWTQSNSKQASTPKCVGLHAWIVSNSSSSKIFIVSFLSRDEGFCFLRPFQQTQPQKPDSSNKCTQDGYDFLSRFIKITIDFVRCGPAIMRKSLARINFHEIPSLLETSIFFCLHHFHMESVVIIKNDYGNLPIRFTSFFGNCHFRESKKSLGVINKRLNVVVATFYITTFSYYKNHLLTMWLDMEDWVIIPLRHNVLYILSSRKK